jgi:hypothetical protein
VSTTPNGVGQLCIWLDALLDTRLATLAKHAGNDAVLAALKAGYLDQPADVFPGIIDDAEFKRAYAERDASTLKHATATQWLFNLGGVMSMLHHDKIVRPYFSDYSLSINVFPYLLSDTEQVSIRRAVQYWTGPETKIRLVYLSPKDLTPQYALNNFICLVDYDPYTWLNEQAEAFASTRCPDITFIAPAIYHQAPPTEVALSTLDPKVGSPFASMQFLTKPFVELALVKPRLFRMVDHAPAKASAPERKTAERTTPPVI